MFDTKSRAAVALLKRLYGDMEFHCDGKCAVFCLTNDVIAETGASEDDLDGVSAMVRQVEGVLLGFTLREREGGVWKVSMRATNPAGRVRRLRRIRRRWAQRCGRLLPYGRA